MRRKNLISIILGCAIGAVLGFTAISHQEPVAVHATTEYTWEQIPEAVTVEEPEEVAEAVEEVPVSEPRHITEAERYLLAAIVYAEANTESLLGKQMVVDVILNRLDSPDFPNCIAQVIYEPYQFWTAGMPTDYESIPNDIYLAIDMELEHQTDTEVLYFRTGRYHEWGTPIRQVGRHYFSK